MPRFAVPGIIDVLVVKDPEQIAALARDPRLDRAYKPRGRLINRMLLGRLTRVLQLKGQPLPPVAERGALRPTAAQAALEARLNEIAAAGIPDAAVASLAAYVRGAGRDKDAGRLAQEAVGCLFAPEYQGTAASWDDAKVLGAAPSNLNPVKGLIWALTGRVSRARATLARMVGDDPSGLHGTGVAIHNLEHAVRRMRRLYADGKGLAPRSAAWAVGNALGAPRQVLRTPTCRMDIEAGRLEPDTLVILQLDAANLQRPGRDLVFMRDAWSRCPAHRWAPELLAAVWRRAAAGGP
ncbi:MAG TPA: hypothetical protein VJU34_06350 [Phenylobacterium sp.]|nr:hypothetical protein [Phenylobacterium sp.]